MSKVFIFCDGGFGNRFNALISGLFLAKCCNKEPLVIWPINTKTGASFTDLFHTDIKEYNDFDHETFWQDYNPLNIIHWNPWKKEVEWHNAMGIYMGIDQFVNSFGDRNILFTSALLCPWVDTDGLRPILDLVPFHDFIYSNALEFIQTNFGNEEFYGLHIRKTDHAYQLDEQKYIEIIKNNQDKKYFICSDDKDTEDMFKSISKNVKVFPKSSYVEKEIEEGGWQTMVFDEFGNGFPFNIKRDKQSVLEAMVDLLVLSYSNIINEDQRSTFLQTALLFKKYRNM